MRWSTLIVGVLLFLFLVFMNSVSSAITLAYLSSMGLLATSILPMVEAGLQIFNFGISAVPGGFISGWFLYKWIEEEESKKQPLIAGVVACILYTIIFTLIRQRISALQISYLALTYIGVFTGVFLGVKTAELMS